MSKAYDNDNNYLKSLLIMGNYHAAVIKCKQSDLEKSYEHFKVFFDNMNSLCKNILNDKQYQEITARKNFELPIYHSVISLEVIKECMEKSVLLFK